MKKSILFTINTFSRAGAETALLALMRTLDPDEYDVSLLVLTAQGEMFRELPENVHVLNKKHDETSVLSGAGKLKLFKGAAISLLKRFNFIRLAPYLISNLADMLKRKAFAPDKLLWRVFAEGAPKPDKEYDLAVAYIEGGSTYYVADRVKARKKAAFVHIDYRMAGYTHRLDRGCYAAYDRIFTVSDEVRDSFLKVYPECAEKTGVFRNILDVSEIKRKALLDGGFKDNFDGTRILTVGRLMAQKAFEISVDALKILKDRGGSYRWYVLGEGDRRAMLEEKIASLGLKDDFILAGAVDNPYPYLKQTDLYVHASRFEGKSIAIQEAQILGCTVLVSDCSGNREQVTDGEDGLLCELTPEAIAEKIEWLMSRPDERKRFAEAASRKYQKQGNDLEKLVSLLKDGN